MIQDRSDWCISRQRSWGLPIPVFYYKDGGDVFINEDTIKKIVDIFKKQGSSAWWELEIKDLLPDKYKDQAIDLVKGEDTLDVWFDSGSSWKTVLVRDNHYPADLYLEGNDQHRGWFQSSPHTPRLTELPAACPHAIRRAHEHYGQRGGGHRDHLRCPRHGQGHDRGRPGTRHDRRAEHRPTLRAHFHSREHSRRSQLRLARSPHTL